MIDLDPLRSASHRHMIDHLSGPFQGGAVDTLVALDAGGKAAVDWTAREPLLLLGTKAPLQADGLTVTVTVTPAAGPPPAPVELRFEPWSEAGAFLLAWRPEVDATVRTAPLFQVALSTAGAPPPWPDALELRLVEGVLGRVLYLLGAEKARVRRQARELAAGRVLPGAKLDSLDRLGADLSVPRLRDRLVYDPKQVGPDGDTSRTVTTQPYPDGREPDESYRRRLALYRPAIQSSPAGARALLRTLRPSFSLVEPDSELAVAMKLVAPPADPARARFLQYLAGAYLVQPTAPVPASRFISYKRRADEEAMRLRLRSSFTFAGVPTLAIMPGLAEALDRVGRCRLALGAAAWQVLAPVDATASRYELGLGVDLGIPPPAELSAMAATHASGHFAGTPLPETIHLLQSMTPALATDDPNGLWLLGPCGIATVHPLAGRQYVSHFPVHGMVISATFPADATKPVPLEVHHQAPGDPGPHVALFFALADSARAWTGPAWTVLDGPATDKAFSRAAPAPAPLVATLKAAGLRSPATPTELAPAVAALRALPPELIATMQLGAAQAGPLLANGPGASQAAAGLVAILRRAGVVAVLPLATTTPGEVLLVLGMVQLPDQATVLGERSAVGFRWYAVPITGQKGRLLRRRGARSQFQPNGELSLVVAVSFARRGRIDPRGQTEPYELRATLPEGELLALEEYERVMNLLERLAPMGVVVNTSDIREAHVDLDGDGKADPLSPRLSRTYRPYRRRPHAGETGDPQDD